MLPVAYSQPLAFSQLQAQGASAPACPAGLSNQPAAGEGTADDAKLHEAFNDFVGETFYGQMLQSLRKSVGKSPRFNGGRGEEVFTKQLDQVLAQKLAKSDGDKLSGSMYRLFTAQRR